MGYHKISHDIEEAIAARNNLNRGSKEHDIQGRRKMKRKRMKIADLWDYLPPEARYVAMDADGEGSAWYWFDKKPGLAEVGYWHANGGEAEYHEIAIAIDYSGDWKDSLHERPQEIKPGMFGKFWDGDGAEPEGVDAFWGYLWGYLPGSSTPYQSPLSSGDDWFRHFRPCTPPAKVEI